MKKLAFCLGIGCIYFVSCSKKDGNTSGSIQGKWIRETAVDWVTAGGITYKDTVSFPSTAYSEFRTDGKVYTYNGGVNGADQYDTSYYEVKGNTIIIGNINSSERDTAVIQTLTANKLSVYIKYVDLSDIYESWATFRK